MLVGVDVGGTYTDAVVADEHRLFSAKVPTTPLDQSEGVQAAIAAALAQTGKPTARVTRFAHGTTVATNALLEGKGARTALLVTEGFTDLIELGRQNRPQLYRLCAARPAPLAQPELRFAVPERMTPQGPLLALASDAAGRLAAQVAQAGVETVAVALLHSYRHPQHELILRDALARERPELHVSLSHEVVGTFREYERAATTEIDAALSPGLAGYLRRLAERLRADGIPEPAIMQSNGGLIDLEAAAEHAAWTVLSGPAAGAAGAAHVSRACGEPNALCLDMGGTSCDVCVVQDGAVQEQSTGQVAGRPMALPMLAVHTVGAGGGSIAWRDPGGALRVGPQSAGADPGPACYGRGGRQPTVTDANLVLGRLGPDAPLAGGVELDRHAAAQAIRALAASLDMGLRDCARGIVAVAVAEMVRALRVVTVERGVDPRDFALLAFGGAGPLHATAIAEELQMRRILCPRHSGVLAALGLLVSDRRRDVQRSVLLSGSAFTDQAVAQAGQELGRAARQALGEREARLEATFEMRYRGQSFELPVEGALAASADQLRDGFELAHRERYGFQDPEQEVELVTVRVTATSPGAEVALGPPAQQSAARSLTRMVVIGDRELELPVLRGEPAPGTQILGPAVVELPESTILVAPGWSGAVDDTGTLVLDRTP